MAKLTAVRNLGLGAVPLALLSCFLLGGCGESLPPTVPVHGKMTWQGKPLGEERVSFQPAKIAEGLPKRPAVGNLNPDGTYRLGTFCTDDGAVPGEYHVLVHSYSSKPSQQKPTAPYVSRIRDKYGDPQRSGLTVTIPADTRGQLEFDFDVTE